MLKPDAFTVGRRSSYDRDLVGMPFGTVKKLGAHVDTDGSTYDGGWVWKTIEEAGGFMFSGAFKENGWDSKDFSVYGLILPTGWDTDVSREPHPSDGVHRLINDAYLIKDNTDLNALLIQAAKK